MAFGRRGSRPTSSCGRVITAPILRVWPGAACGSPSRVRQITCQRASPIGTCRSEGCKSTSCRRASCALPARVTSGRTLLPRGRLHESLRRLLLRGRPAVALRWPLGLDKALLEARLPIRARVAAVALRRLRVAAVALRWVAAKLPGLRVPPVLLRRVAELLRRAVPGWWRAVPTARPGWRQAWRSDPAARRPVFHDLMHHRDGRLHIRRRAGDRNLARLAVRHLLVDLDARARLVLEVVDRLAAAADHAPDQSL